MRGKGTFRIAVERMVETAQGLCEDAGWRIEDVDHVVPHQANMRIIEGGAHRLGIPREKTIVNIERYGNTSSASIPIALFEAVDDGRVQPGDLVLVCGFGAGMTWASALMRWGASR